jgi:hypothetical protein
MSKLKRRSKLGVHAGFERGESVSDRGAEFWEREMGRGYLDGGGENCPEPSSNRSASYRHGSRNGREEILKIPRPSAAFLRMMAQASIAEDRQQSVK